MAWNPVFALTVAALFLIGSSGMVHANVLPIRTLAKGAFSGIQEPSEQVIKDSSLWEKVWAAHSFGRKGLRRPEVNFAEEMVVLVTAGRKPTGGYGVEVVKAEAAQDVLSIHVARKSPRPGGMSIQALTAPFHMVAVPKSELQVKFVEEAVPEKSLPKP